jgi:hypothetical protein
MSHIFVCVQYCIVGVGRKHYSPEEVCLYFFARSSFPSIAAQSSSPGGLTHLSAHLFLDCIVKLLRTINGRVHIDGPTGPTVQSQRRRCCITIGGLVGCYLRSAKL